MSILAWSSSGPGVTETKVEQERSDTVEWSLSEFMKTWTGPKCPAAEADALRILAPDEAKDSRIVQLLGRFLDPLAACR
jgi:hypothetical protein